MSIEKEIEDISINSSLYQHSDYLQNKRQVTFWRKELAKAIADYIREIIKECKPEEITSDYIYNYYTGLNKGFNRGINKYEANLSKRLGGII